MEPYEPWKHIETHWKLKRVFWEGIQKNLFVRLSENNILRILTPQWSRYFEYRLRPLHWRVPWFLGKGTIPSTIPSHQKMVLGSAIRIKWHPAVAATWPRFFVPSHGEKKQFHLTTRTILIHYFFQLTVTQTISFQYFVSPTTLHTISDH